ncbi:hypothetical protein SAMN04487989_101374 [Bizionia echini]|uniref:Lipoprotein n=1 Tax=Bizionia echini TaxID=649333 RepID=A0A1I4YYP9_9FLAO|nr:hypothetical protein [Bizionia echini]SFN42923.1 hypothetical protein SAMN04487989_101374 [Bizionia echini]
MRKLTSVFTFALLFNLIFGCSSLTGEEIARLPINQLTISDDNLISKEATLSLKKGEEIAVWSEMDIEYEGNVDLRFQIEVSKNGENIGVLEIDPTDKNITIGELKSSINNKTSWSFTGKNSEITIEDNGEYTFKGILIASENPTLKIDKAEIILKK